MRAVVVTSFENQLEVRELAVPQPGPGQILVRIEANGLCHTDIHAARGDWPVKPTPPFVPGHESVGVVEQTEPGATAHQLGNRVAVPWLGPACGACEYCVSGWKSL
ncbi:alcohol dehydrogenase catalytic domain-containing protein [Actinoplanes philippinensis]|uniref:alcohol dehydrogenase catalytic domain-containing protein n=1 Tax=Actinoplanes philippinensis TaxID=35752 RepID=UPI0033CEC82E